MVTNLQDFVADYIQYRLRLHGNRRIPNLVHSCRRDCENDLMRSVALIFEEKHEEELRKMVEMLCENESFSFNRYIEVRIQRNTFYSFCKSYVAGKIKHIWTLLIINWILTVLINHITSLWQFYEAGLTRALQHIFFQVMEHFVCIHNETPSQMSYGRLIALIAFAGLVATRLSDMKYFAEVSLIMSYTSKFLQKRIALTWPQHKRSWVSLHYVVMCLSRFWL